MLHDVSLDNNTHEIDKNTENKVSEKNKHTREVQM